jgi:hypothetical protein
MLCGPRSGGGGPYGSFRKPYAQQLLPAPLANFPFKPGTHKDRVLSLRPHLESGQMSTSIQVNCELFARPGTSQNPYFSNPTSAALFIVIVPVLRTIQIVQEASPHSRARAQLTTVFESVMIPIAAALANVTVQRLSPDSKPTLHFSSAEPVSLQFRPQSTPFHPLSTIFVHGRAITVPASARSSHMPTLLRVRVLPPAWQACLSRWSSADRCCR